MSDTQTQIPNINPAAAGATEETTTPSLSEHDQAMVDKAREAAAADAAAETPADTTTDESGSEGEASTSERPDNVPEEFWDAEKGEVNMEALLAAAAANKGGDESADADDDNEGEDAGEGDDAETSPSFDWESIDRNDLANQIVNEGGLNEDTVKMLTEKAGIPQDFIDSFVEGQKAIGQMQADALFATVGGRDEFAAMINWAGQGNVSEEKANAINEALNNPAAESTQMMVKQLYADYTGAMGKDPTLVDGGKTTEAPEVFKTQADVTRAMRDPRYGKSTTEGREYTNWVTSTLAKSRVSWS